MGCGTSNVASVTEPGARGPKAEVVFVLGGPGSGKGTQCEKIVKDYCFNHISTGDLLRAEREKGGPDGEMIDNLMKEGKLVPSDLLVRLIKKEIESNGNTGRYLLDGFPRSLENWQSWTRIIGPAVNVRFLLMFECSFEVMEQRLLKRGETSGRADDNAETIKKRFETFTSETQPIIAEFDRQRKVQRINSETSPEEVHQNVEQVLSRWGIQKIARPQVIFVLGGPGSGKGTQCVKIARDFQFTHISTGDLLREEARKDGPDKAQIEAILKEGKLAPSELLVKSIKREFLRRQLKGRFLIDGFPRNKDNLVWWDKLMTPFADVKLVLSFDCPEKVLVERLLERGKTSGRIDDNEESIKKRLATYQQETIPIIEQFKARGQLAVLNSQFSVEAVYVQVRKALKEKSLFSRLDGSKPLKQKYVIFVVGGPGSGKGTQCAEIVKRYGFTHLSTGDLLREEAKKKTPESAEIQKYMKEGQLVPSELVVRLAQKHIDGSIKRKFLLDGFPRNQENLDTWNRVIKNIKVKYLLFFDCSEETMEKRLMGRAQTSGRSDDNPETIKKRLQVFVAETKPIIEGFGQNQILRVSAEDEAQAVTEQVEKIFLEKKLNR